MTKNNCFLLLFSLLTIIVCGQETPSKFWIQFIDKNNTPYKIEKPSDFLTQKAIKRREKQNIKINYSDLPVNPSYIDIIQKTCAKVLTSSKWYNAITAEVNDSATLSQIKSFPFVKTVQRTYKIGNKRIKTSRYLKLEHLSIFNENRIKTNNNTNIYDYGMAYNQISMLSGDYLHNLGYSGKGMTIAVLDAGFRNVNTITTVFDSMIIQKRLLGTKDFVNPNSNIYGEHYHGMMVLSIMAANYPGYMVGTAPNASYWLLRSEDAGQEDIVEEDNWVTAAEYADSVGADVIQTSLGYTDFDDNTQNHQYSDLNGRTSRASLAATMATRKGMIVVCSAGNEGGGIWQYIGIPADADSILSVGAVDDEAKRSDFSSVGPTADGRIKPDVMAQGGATTVSSTDDGIIIAGSGTSFASPVVAGLTACLWQAFPQLSNMEIIEAIKKSSSKYANPDNYYGYGIPDFSNAFLKLSGINVKNLDSNLIDVNPNPFNDYIYIYFKTKQSKEIYFELMDTRGYMIYKSDVKHTRPGFNFFSIDNLQNVRKGIYILRIIFDNYSYSYKVMKTN